MAAGKSADAKGSGGLGSPCGEVLGAHVGVGFATVGADRTGERRLILIYVCAIERGIGFERGENCAEQGGVFEHLDWYTLQSLEFLEEGLARRRRRRHVTAAELR